MDREIKFRGKSLKNKKWVYGDLMRNICATRIVRYKETDNESEQRADWDYIEVDDSTVGQFTGLTDCNGTPIYEGDVLELNPITRIQGYVRWDDALAQFVVNIIDSKQWYCIENGVVEVIGNVFDNPELIPNQPTAI